MYAYSGNGFSFRAVNDDYVAQIGEVVFNDYATTDQLNAVFPVYNSGIPILTKSQKLTALNNEYNPQILSAQTQIAIAVASTKNLTAETTWRNTLATLQTEYNTKRTAILNA